MSKVNYYEKQYSMDQKSVKLELIIICQVKSVLELKICESFWWENLQQTVTFTTSYTQAVKYKNVQVDEIKKR